MKTTKKANAQNSNSEHSNSSNLHSLQIKIKQNHSNCKIHIDARINLFTIMNYMR